MDPLKFDAIIYHICVFWSALYMIQGVFALNYALRKSCKNGRPIQLLFLSGFLMKLYLLFKTSQIQDVSFDGVPPSRCINGSLLFLLMNAVFLLTLTVCVNAREKGSVYSRYILAVIIIGITFLFTVYLISLPNEEFYNGYPVMTSETRVYYLTLCPTYSHYWRCLVPGLFLFVQIPVLVYFYKSSVVNFETTGRFRCRLEFNRPCFTIPDTGISSYTTCGLCDGVNAMLLELFLLYCVIMVIIRPLHYIYIYRVLSYTSFLDISPAIFFLLMDLRLVLQYSWKALCDNRKETVLKSTVMGDNSYISR